MTWIFKVKKLETEIICDYTPKANVFNTSRERKSELKDKRIPLWETKRGAAEKMK